MMINFEFSPRIQRFFVLQKQLLLFLPLILAYLLQGAKQAPSFALVFALAWGVWVLANHQGTARPIPAFIFWPFVMFLAWSWTALASGAPLDSFLFFLSRAYLTILVGGVVYQYANEDTFKRFPDLIILLGAFEAALILYAQITVGYAQKAGYLRYPLHSALLLTVAFFFALD